MYYFYLFYTERIALNILSFYFFFFPQQKSEAKLDEVLKEIKSLRELVSSQEKRIAKLEEQLSKMDI